MGDYISREVAIERIRPHVKPTTVYGEGYLQAIEHAIDILELIPKVDVQPTDRWISCKEKMPDDGEDVLFVYVSEIGIKSVHYGYHQTIKGLGSSWAKPSGGWQYADGDVTHWQPIPKPPVNE
jgi:hypothetical protein